jgi:4-hydroxy-tetrahydrodipicolinate synthase/2-dehydro-3-deoxy-D-gluconate aldolase
MKYSGIVTPLITPFKLSGEVDYNSIDTLVNFLKSIGVAGIFPSSSTGLFPFLNIDERKKMLEQVLKNSGSLKVFAGVGAADTDSAIELARHAKDVGADAIVLMPSYYIKSDQTWIINHFEKVLEKVDINFMIYNIPQLTGSTVELKTIEHLKSNFSQVSGIKDSSGDMRYFSKLMRFKASNFSVFQGQDDLMLISLTLGADGGVCGTTNFVRYIVDLYDHYRNGAIEKARILQIEQINNIMDVLALSNFPAGYYYAFYNKFKVAGGYRNPMLAPSKEASDSILKWIR